MSQIYDVIIIGAGPAGSTAAYELARENFNVLILEKEKFPRYKACGGGITYKTKKIIPFDISPVIEKTIHKIGFSHKYENYFSKESDRILMYCLMRDKFDDFLIKKAVEVGATFYDSQKVEDIKQEDDNVVVSVNGIEYAAKVLIGADGSNSMVSRRTGINKEIIKGITFEGELELNAENNNDIFSDQVSIDWGTIPGGYAWIFPKSDHISVGVGGPVEVSKYLKTYYNNIINGLGLDASREISLKAHNIPYRLSKGNFSKGNILLVGDAAGLTDPLTGEGIYYAIRSSQIAAKSVKEYFSGEKACLDSYSDRINREIMSELLTVIPILNIFHAIPLRIHNYLRNSDRAWDAFIRVLRGEKLYSSFPDSLGRYKFLWGAINYTASIFYRRNEMIFRHRNALKK